MLEPYDVREMLRSHHVKCLTEWQQRLLAARVCGTGIASIAAVFQYSEGKVRKDFERVEDIILGPLGFGHDLALMAQWFAYNLECCLPVAKVLLEKREIFPGEKSETSA